MAWAYTPPVTGTSPLLELFLHIPSHMTLCTQGHLWGHTGLICTLSRTVTEWLEDCGQDSQSTS